MTWLCHPTGSTSTFVPGNVQERKFINAHGESMAPTFSDGGVLLMDFGSRNPSSIEGLYVLEVRDQLYTSMYTCAWIGHGRQL